MTREEITDTVRHTIAELYDVELDQVEQTDRFAEELGGDSLDIVELVLEVEDEFQISIEDEHLEKIITVSDLIDLVASKLEAPAA
jgi:acyl carrier protein